MTTVRNQADLDKLTSSPIKPLRHPGRWVMAAIVIFLLALLAKTLFTNERFEWGIVGQYIFAQPILDGVFMTLKLTIIATVLSLLAGTTLALMRVSENFVLRYVSAGYIWFFRSVPLLVQLIFLYNISALFPSIRIGIPFNGPTLVEGSANALLTPMIAAILAFALNESAYTAETIRGGIISVDKGQIEAGKALGLSSAKVVRHIILPQALKVFIPPFGNQVINLLKLTSLVSVIALADILYSAQLIYSQTFETIPLLIVVSIWYLFLVSILSYGQSVLEKRLAQDSTRKRRPVDKSRIKRNSELKAPQ